MKDRAMPTSQSAQQQTSPSFAPRHGGHPDYPKPDTRVFTTEGGVLPYREALEWDHHP